MRFFKFAKLLICLAFLCVCPVLVYADVSCPTGYVKISEPDSIIVTNASSCPSGHTKLSDMSGNTSVTNCTTGLSSGFCTYYSEPCQSGKYFDGTTHKTCVAGSYCDGSGTATPGVPGCSKACPENSTSTSGATKCTCNTGYEMIGGACVLKTCESGYYLNGNECTVCPIGSYCANNIKTACDDGYTTDATGATDVSQCYTTCEQQCTQQTCPDNATCTHGTTVTTGKQYIGGTCDAEQTMCEVNFECNENFELVDGVCKLVPEFTIITTDMPAGTKFQLSVAATGTFYIDWGDGTVTMNTYSHTYKDSGARTIGMAGQATQYGGYRLDGAIEFLSNPYIETVQGSLGAIFGTLADGKNPTFQKTFLGCTGLKNVSEDLFSGITGGAESMFYMTFALCTSLKSIPENLFAGINSNAMDLYWRTFEGCTALESIPDGLFSSNTITGVHTFRHTFKNCTSLKTIPVGLFKNITAVTQGVFYETFLGCTGLNNIPSDLFVNIKNTAAVAFFGTFSGCTGLTELPNGLFRNIEGKPVWADFGSTFENCTGLEGYIPNDMFEKLDSINFDATTMSNIFANTGLDTKCPSDTYQYITGFESAWGNHVSCTLCPYDHPNSMSGATSESQCYIPCEQQCTQQQCPDNATCTHGATVTTGKQYVGGTCNAEQTMCEVNITCASGYDLIGGTCVLKTCESGYYLNGDDCEICPIGSYCANNIKTACDDGYTTDATGATDVSQCYTTCEQQCTQQACPDNATCTHGTAITTGKQYIGGTCNAEQTMCGIDITCDTGFNEVDGGIRLVEKTPVIPVDYREYSTGAYGFISADGKFAPNYAAVGLKDKNTWGSVFNYGTVYGRASCQPSMSENSIGYMYINENMDAVLDGAMSVEDFESGLTAISGKDKAEFMAKILNGFRQGTKSKQDVYDAMFISFATEIETDYSATSSGQYCYCQLTSFISTNGVKQSIVDAPWIFFGDFDSNSSCGVNCVGNCGPQMRHAGEFYEAFRAALYGVFETQLSSAMCEIDIIDIPVGYYLPANTTEPVQCPENNYCPGLAGAMFNSTESQGKNQCPDGTTSFAGASGIEQCTGPKSLYIGDDIQMNLTTVKPQTARVMVFDVLGELYYGGLSNTPKPINNGTEKQFRILDGDTSYWMHDYTVK